MLRLVVLVVISFCVSLCTAQCVPLVAPTCYFDSSDSFVLIGQEFWDGIGSVAAAQGTPVAYVLDEPDDVFNVDLLTNCGLVIIEGLGVSDLFAFSAADLQAISDYYDAGGLIILICDDNNSPYCPAALNPIFPTVLSPIVTVRYTDPAVSANIPDCAPIPNGNGAGNSFLNGPTDFRTFGFYSVFSSSFNIAVSHPYCILGDKGNFAACSASQVEQLIALSDFDVFLSSNSGTYPCIDTDFVFRLGENIGAYIAVAETICGGAGGDPHIFTFDGHEIDLHFENQKNYVFYGNSDFRAVIHTSGTPSKMYITSIGVTMGAHHQLLAGADENGDPVFYYNGEMIVDSVSTPIGEANLFTPGNLKLKGALDMLSRYLIVGLTIENRFTIVGGYHPTSGVFFNIEVRKSSHRSDFGFLLSAHETHARGADFLSAFETPSLFD